MIYFAAFIDPGFLYLNKIANVNVSRQLRIRTQAGKRTNPAAVSHYRIFHYAIFENLYAVADFTIADNRIRAYFDVIAKHYISGNQHIDVQLYIPPDDQCATQIESGRVAQCYAVAHQRF